MHAETPSLHLTQPMSVISVLRRAERGDAEADLFPARARASLYSFALCVGRRKLKIRLSQTGITITYGYANNICLPQRVAIMRTTLQSFFFAYVGKAQGWA